MFVCPLLRADTISTGGEFPQFTKGFMISGMQVVLVYLNFGKSGGITNSFKTPQKALKNIFISVSLKKNLVFCSQTCCLIGYGYACKFLKPDHSVEVAK